MHIKFGSSQIIQKAVAYFEHHMLSKMTCALPKEMYQGMNVIMQR